MVFSASAVMAKAHVLGSPYAFVDPAGRPGCHCWVWWLLFVLMRVDYRKLQQSAKLIFPLMAVITGILLIVVCCDVCGHERRTSLGAFGKHHTCSPQSWPSLSSCAVSRLVPAEHACTQIDNIKET